MSHFVNFFFAPSFIIFTFFLGDLKIIGCICFLVFSLASALLLARFNVAIDDDRPKWQSNYFIGMPTPAAAIVVLLPIYLAALGVDLRHTPLGIHLVLIYVLAIAFMMVSTVPTFSGKLLGERIGRALSLARVRYQQLRLQQTVAVVVYGLRRRRD